MKSLPHVTYTRLAKVMKSIRLEGWVTWMLIMYLVMYLNIYFDFITLYLSGTPASYNGKTDECRSWRLILLKLFVGGKNFDLMTSNYLICTKFDKVY